MTKYERGQMWNERVDRGRSIGCTGCFPVAMVAAAILIGVFVWRVDGAAKAQQAVAEPVAVQETEPTKEDVEKLCSLKEVICDGEAFASAAQEEWIDKLERCESSGNPKAINPKDLDGTPSYGSFQFKPSTFNMYAKRYGIEGELMDRSAQREIVVNMLGDEKVRWTSEFPDCVRKLGIPPKN